MAEVIRLFVEKRGEMNVVAEQTKWDLRHNLGIRAIEELRFLNRYDIEGMTREEFDKAKNIILSEPNQDIIFEEVYLSRTASGFSLWNISRVSTTSAPTQPSNAYSFLPRVSAVKF